MSGVEFLWTVLLLLITFALRDISVAMMKIARLFEEKERRDRDEQMD